MATEVASSPQQSGIGKSLIRICGAGSGIGRGAGCGVATTLTLVRGPSARGRSISGCVFFISTAGFTGGSGNTVMRAVSFFGECVGMGVGAGIAAAAARTGEGESGAGGGLGGGRVGNCIRTVCRPETDEAAGLAEGETMIRTVSFLGSCDSDMCGGTFNKTLPDQDYLVTSEVDLAEIFSLCSGEQIVTACAGNPLCYEFSDGLRLRQNHARVDVGRIGLGPRH